MKTNSKLLLRVRDTGDSASWREFVTVYEPLIIAYAQKKGLAAPAAVDAAQEVFVRLLKALPNFEFDRNRARFRTWLWQVTHSVIVDRARVDGRRAEAERQWGEQCPPTSDDQEWRSMHRRRVLQHALEKVESGVKPVHWACFARHVLEQRSAAEVAAELKINTNTVYINASRVLAKVREACAKLMEELNDDGDYLPT
jgi:RNA polymerase sigma-70 factor, ECF subfamily